MTIALNGIIFRLLTAVVPGYSERRQLEARFNEAVRLHHNLIMRLCFGYARSAAELDDLHQDVLVNIWQSLPKFRGDSSLKTWIYRVALNTCVSTVRTRLKQPETLPIETLVNTSDEPDRKLSMLRDLHESISRLSPTDKAIMLLWLDEVSYDEIAALTGLSRSAVSIRIHRAKEKLKDYINNKLYN